MRQLKQHSHACPYVCDVIPCGITHHPACRASGFSVPAQPPHTPPLPKVSINPRHVRAGHSFFTKRFVNGPADSPHYPPPSILNYSPLLLLPPWCRSFGPPSRRSSDGRRCTAPACTTCTTFHRESCEERTGRSAGSITLTATDRQGMARALVSLQERSGGESRRNRCIGC